ncbi:sigma-70 family RNA polymerase sigma factor [Salegentibacter sp. BLCTC]|uniref:RNA polymerase sigma factor n=1 Tax=Salegentibacter sp. BLCTC TaxID=2697368 RepID=UPI00187B4A57|nr:sigma-70 family RNA polymerase sigma factor [Salegentibacter sp. BLCTC]MBE7641072.1 sigma-70 family RNA polymerase sigma factor [Salegentibacter sp. BLCTC]
MEYIEGKRIFKDEVDEHFSVYLNDFNSRETKKSRRVIDCKHSSGVSSSVNPEKVEDLAFLFWEKIKRGDMDALGQLYDLYVDELFLYGMEKVQDKIRVMDAIHDLFVDLYKYRNSIASPSNVKYYLLRSLKRKVYRKQSSKKCINLQDSFFEKKTVATELSYEEKIIEGEYSKEKKDKLKLALTFLTKRQQKALHLRFTENKPYNEIANTMNISIATSRTLVYRAILVLKKHCLSLFLTVSGIFI